MRVLTILAVLGLVATSPAQAMRETRSEFDILKAVNVSIPGLRYTRCFRPPPKGQVIAHACYKVAAKDVLRTVAILETDFDHPPMVTHGENWHGHGIGTLPLTEEIRQGFKHIGDPEYLSGMLTFTAPAQRRFFQPQFGLPQVIALGELDGLVYVRLAFV